MTVAIALVCRLTAGTPTPAAAPAPAPRATGSKTTVAAGHREPQTGAEAAAAPLEPRAAAQDAGTMPQQAMRATTLPALSSVHFSTGAVGAGETEGLLGDQSFDSAGRASTAPSLVHCPLKNAAVRIASMSPAVAGPAVAVV